MLWRCGSQEQSQHGFKPFVTFSPFFDDAAVSWVHKKFGGICKHFLGICIKVRRLYKISCIYNVWPGCQYLLYLYLGIGLQAYPPWLLLIGRVEGFLNGSFTALSRTNPGYVPASQNSKEWCFVRVSSIFCISCDISSLS